MTPMNEPELRRELSQVDLPTPIDNSSLADAVIRRGRGVKRRRVAVAAIAALAVVAGGVGLGVATLPGQKAMPAEPTPTPSVTTAPTGSPSPAVTSTPDPSPGAQSPTSTPSGPTTGSPAPGVAPWDDPQNLPDNYGSLEGHPLPLDPRVGEKNDETEVSTTKLQLTCQQQPFTMPTLSALTGGRSLVLSGPTYARWESVLVFGTEAQALAFVDEVRSQAKACAAAGPTDPKPVSGVDSMTNRSVPVYHDDETLGTGGFSFGGYTEVSYDDGATYTLAPDASITFLARSGNVVAVTQDGGEGAGDMSTDTGIASELSSTLKQILNP